jgi:hypothetical protein
VEATIELEDIKEERDFWDIFKENLDRVEDFYKEQLKQMINQFHSLTKHAIRLVIQITLLIINI